MYNESNYSILVMREVFCEAKSQVLLRQVEKQVFRPNTVISPLRASEFVRDTQYDCILRASCSGREEGTK
jgi:hypothetical protein